MADRQENKKTVVVVDDEPIIRMDLGQMLEELNYEVVDHGKEICFPSGMEKMGPVTQKLYETLTGIQMGRIEAPEGWIRKIL